LHRFIAETALIYAILIILFDGRHALVERFLRRFFDDHRNARIGVIHRDAAAHGARADYRCFANLISFCVFRNIRNLGDDPLPEERVNQSLGLRGEEAILEDLRFALAALGETEAGRGLHSVDCRERRRLSALGTPRVFPGDGENSRVLGRVLKLFIALPRPGRRFGHDFAREGHGAFQQIALDNFVDDSGR